MNEKIKQTSFLFEKIKRLYPTFVRPDELDIEVWTEVLDGYSQTEILDALKEYRKNTPYDRAPNPATFKGFLQEKTFQSTRDEFKAIEPASQHMEADIASGNCHHLLGVYQMAVDYILKDRLIELIGVSEWQKLRYGQKYDLAEENNLFDDFDDVLRLVCKRNFGVEEQFQSENDLINAKERRSVTESINTLSAHWGLD